MAEGTPDEVAKNTNSITGNYLSGRMKIELPLKRRKLTGKYITVKKAAQNNLKDVTVKFPLGVVTLVTGVSGSGKSSLVNECLYKNAYMKYMELKRLFQVRFLQLKA